MSSRLAALPVAPYDPRPKTPVPKRANRRQGTDPMLNSLRKYTTSWVAQILLGLLVLSFSVWGVADIFTGYGSNDLVTVGSARVSLFDYQRNYDQAIDRLAQQTGQQFSPEQAQRAGIPAQVISQLVSQATLDNSARRMGLGISNEELGAAIARDPRYHGPGGLFDREFLKFSISRQGYTEDSFIADQRRAVMRAQLAQAFGGGISAPQSYIRAVNEFQTEARDISYIVLAAPALTEIPEPSDADLNAYFEANKETWRTPELRAVSYFLLASSELAKPEEVTDEDAKKRYDASPARFATAEKRKVEQIVFKDRAEADAAATAITGGKTFDAIVTERKLAPADVDLGLVTREGIADDKIAEAAFALTPNTTSAVIDGAFGPVILRVTTVEPSVVTTFEQAKSDLKTEIARERAGAEVSDMHDAIEDERAGGATLSEVAKKYSLTVKVLPAVDATGNDIDGKLVAEVPNGLVAAAFASDVGLENDPIQPEQGAFAWYEVTAVTEPRERPLSEVKDKAIAAWKDAERAKRLAASADAVKKRLQNKEDIAAVATSLSLQVQKLAKITRVTTPVGDMSAASMIAAFTGPKGFVADAVGAQPMTHIVLVVDEVAPPGFTANNPALAQTKQQLDGQFLNDLLGLYIAELQSSANVRFNQVALQTVLTGTATAPLN